MELLRSCYRSGMRLYPDRPDIIVQGAWRWSPPGAKTLPLVHSFGSRQWDPWDMPALPLLGEVPPRGTYSKGAPNPRLDGQHFCGTVSAWLNGIPYSDRPGLALASDGMPLCCHATSPPPPPSIASGSLALSGVSGFAHSAAGSLAFSGLSGFGSSAAGELALSGLSESGRFSAAIGTIVFAGLSRSATSAAGSLALSGVSGFAHSAAGELAFSGPLSTNNKRSSGSLALSGVSGFAHSAAGELALSGLSGFGSSAAGELALSGLSGFGSSAAGELALSGFGQLPHVLVSDDFTRGGYPQFIDLEPMSFLGQWVHVNGHWESFGFANAEQTSTSFEQGVYVADVLFADCQGYLEGWTIPSHAFANLGFVVRYVDAGNHFLLMAWPATSTLNVWKGTAGSYAIVATAPWAGATGSGFFMNFKLDSDTMTFWIGSDSVSFVSSDFLGSTTVGLWSNILGTSIGAFEVDSLNP